MKILPVILLLMSSLLACTEKGSLERAGDSIEDAVEEIGSAGERSRNSIDDASESFGNQIQNAAG